MCTGETQISAMYRFTSVRQTYYKYTTISPFNSIKYKTLDKRFFVCFVLSFFFFFFFFLGRGGGGGGGGGWRAVQIVFLFFLENVCCKLKHIAEALLMNNHNNKTKIKKKNKNFLRYKKNTYLEL